MQFDIDSFLLGVLVGLFIAAIVVILVSFILDKRLKSKTRKFDLYMDKAFEMIDSAKQYGKMGMDRERDECLRESDRLYREARKHSRYFQDIDRKSK